MALTILPSNLLRKIAPKKQVERLVTQRLTLNRAALQSLVRSGILTKKQAETLALRIIKDYKRKYREELREGATKKAALEDTLNQKRLMVQRVQNAAVFEITKAVKKTYRGERYEWLPSDAETPDPEHQLNYGKIFVLGRGEAPGDRYGCRCGMRILTDEELSLDEAIGL